MLSRNLSSIFGKLSFFMEFWPLSVQTQNRWSPVCRNASGFRVKLGSPNFQNIDPDNMFIIMVMLPVKVSR